MKHSGKSPGSAFARLMLVAVMIAALIAMAVPVMAVAQEASIDVEKWVLDENGQRVERIYNARIGEVYGFYCQIVNDGDVPLWDIRFWDILSCSLDNLHDVTLNGETMSLSPEYDFKPLVLHPVAGSSGWDPYNPLDNAFEDLCSDPLAYYELTSWEDTNVDGRLSYCDQIDMWDEQSGRTVWFHVEKVPYTVLVTNPEGEEMYIDSVLDFEEIDVTDPKGTQWREVCCRGHYLLMEWIDNPDTDPDGVLGFCDTIVLLDKKTGERSEYHVEEVVIDLIASREVVLDDFSPGFVLEPEKSLVFEFKAEVVNFCHNRNIQCAKGRIDAGGPWVVDCDDAWIEIPSNMVVVSLDENGDPTDEFLPGSILCVDGLGFIAGETYDIWIVPYEQCTHVTCGDELASLGGPGLMATVTADATGAFRVCVDLPPELEVCTLWEIVADNQSCYFHCGYDGLDAFSCDEWGFHIYPEAMTILLLSLGLVVMGGYYTLRRRKGAESDT